MPLNDPLPYLTADLPGIGGTLKAEVEDFVVDEIPAYEPEGAGEFVYLWVEKRGLSAEQLTSHLARELKIAHQDIGMAGMKDRQAVTRQYVSVPVKCEPLLSEHPHPQIHILRSARHRNKLRTGHLRGNRFSIRIRDAVPGAMPRAEAIAARLQAEGVPNYFGDQRFGRDAETLNLGLALLRGEKKPGDIPRARRKFLLRLALSAAQSALFNSALAQRLREAAERTSGTGGAVTLLNKVLPGDVMQVVASGGPFVVEDVAREQQRFDKREIVISGPMFGPKMKAAQGEAGEREQRLLVEAGLTIDMFSEYASLTSGTRRPYLIWPEDLSVTAEGNDLRLQVTLPSGSYATVLLREFQKSE